MISDRLFYLDKKFKKMLKKIYSQSWLLWRISYMIRESEDFETIAVDTNKFILYKWKIFTNEYTSTQEVLYEIDSMEKMELFIKNELVNLDHNLALVFLDFDRWDMLCYTDFMWVNSLYVNMDGEISWSINRLIWWMSFLDYRYLWIIRKFGYNINNLTPYSNIKRLDPWMIYKAKIWFLFEEYTKIQLTPTTKDLKLSLLDYVEDCVKRRICDPELSWETVWVLCSWWLDSSIITALLLKHKPDDVTLKFFTTENAEDSKYAQDLAEYLGIDLIKVDVKQLKSKEIFDINETPVDLWSVIPNIALFQAVKEQWINYVFTWDWADELFRWYKRNAEDFDYHYHDILNELTYYHLPRLEKAATHIWLKMYAPFMGREVVMYSLIKDIKNFKQDLKDFCHWLIPDSIIERTKEPLKNKEIREDKKAYQEAFLDKFISYAHENENIH